MNGQNVNTEHRDIEPMIAARFAREVYSNAEVSLPAKITLSGSAWELIAQEAQRASQTLDDVISRFIDDGIAANTRRHLAAQDSAN